MTYSKWNNATQGERELYMRGCGWNYKTVRSRCKKSAEQLTSAARLVINYSLTGKKIEWEVE